MGYLFASCLAKLFLATNRFDKAVSHMQLCSTTSNGCRSTDSRCRNSATKSPSPTVFTEFRRSPFKSQLFSHHIANNVEAAASKSATAMWAPADARGNLESPLKITGKGEH
ncbi:hypothetical protein IF1G_09331 [Cordyceps javanica]|uniref:Uncharacterized protein n=1 Tax=Cordyceps javanica TaxID=43265 RepID=A0A545US06_9HYPO|nr:hypothetical protein IF1G_09331 [Cordyceps javanica]